MSKIPDTKTLMKEAKKDLKIDKFSLDKNCIQQPDLYLKWSERLNSAENAMEVIQHRLTQFKSKEYVRVKEQALIEGIKMTDAQAKSSYRSTSAYKAMTMSSEKISKKVAVLRSIVMAFVQRRSMLETLAKLHGQDYFHGG